MFLHARATATTVIGPYQNEYVWMITTTPAHDKVVDIKEFIDSAYTLDYVQRLFKALGEGKGEGGPSMWDYRGEEAARGFDNNLLGGPPIGPSPCT